MSKAPAAAAALKTVLSPPKERLTQAKLAERLGVTQQAVSNWCADRARPEPRHRALIEELTGIPRTLWMTNDEREAAGLDGEAA